MPRKLHKHNLHNMPVTAVLKPPNENSFQHESSESHTPKNTYLHAQNHQGPRFPFFNSSIITHHNRQRLKHHLVPLIMPHEPPLQHPPQPLQPRQLPPLVDAHHAAPVDPHHHAGPVALARVLADGVLVAGPAGGELDAVEDVGEVGAEGLAVRFREVVRADGGDRLERVDELVRAAVGRVEADEFGHARCVIRVGDDDGGVGGVGPVVVVVTGAERPEGFLEKEGDVFTGGDLDRGEGGGDLVGEGLDGVVGLGGHVVDEGAEEAPFLERGGDGLGAVGRGDGVAVARDDLEEVVHVFEDLVVRGAAVEGAGAEGVDGGGFGGDGGGVGDGAFEGCACGFVDEVRGRGNEGHCERFHGED